MENTDLVILLIFATLLGLIPAAIASKKGYSFGLWWLFGAALFIVALPVAILIKPEQGASPQSNLHQGKQGMKKCPFCAESIKHEAAVCRYCGRDLGQWPDWVTSRTGVSPSNWKVFLHYGNEKHGRFSLDTVRQMRIDAVVPDNAFFWVNGLSNWLPISELEKSFT